MNNDDNLQPNISNQQNNQEEELLSFNEAFPEPEPEEEQEIDVENAEPELLSFSEAFEPDDSSLNQ